MRLRYTLAKLFLFFVTMTVIGFLIGYNYAIMTVRQSSSTVKVPASIKSEIKK